MKNIENYFYKTHFEKTHQPIPVRLKKIDRYEIIKILAEFEAKKGAEIGVWRGEFSQFMCQTIPDLELLCVDPWKPVDDIRSQMVGVEPAEDNYQKARKNLENFNAKLIRKTSLEAVNDVPDNSLDFVYIDGSHEFDNVVQDIIQWSKKVKIGGMIAGHDYCRSRDAGVIQAVDAYVYTHRIPMAFITNELEPSWLFFK